MELREHALKAFQACVPEHKAQLALELQSAHMAFVVDVSRPFASPDTPGQPARPDLVDPKDVPRRSPFTAAGHAALMHSITHIEFNAINLALDCIWRYDNMPEAFYRDWANVAAEEAKHFTLLSGHLKALGYAYGDFPAHTGLWTICYNTAPDLTARMALVPRTMEARGLDATPLIQAKLAKVGTGAALEARAILDIILAEEVGHVATGNRWYHWLCAQHNLDADAFYAQAAVLYAAPRPKPPFNYAARKAAGFTPAEMQRLDLDAGLAAGTEVGLDVAEPSAAHTT